MPGRLGGRLVQKLRGAEPATLVWVLLLLVLLFLVAGPIAKLFAVSFEARDSGQLTFANYLQAYGRARYVDALINSLLLGASAGTLAVLLAVPAAWAVSRTDMPGKGFTWASVLGAFIVPPYLTAIGWILLA